MAAHGLTTPYTTVIEIVSAIIVTGAQDMITRAAGKGDKKRTDTVFSLALEVAAIFSIAVTALLYIFNGLICTWLGADAQKAELRQLLISYNTGFFAVVPGLIFYPILCAMATLNGRKKYTVASTIVLSVADISLNYLLVGPFKLGMLGVGLSSTVAQMLAVLVVTPSFFSKPSMFGFSFVFPKLSEVGKMLKIGLPKLTRKLSTTTKKILMNRLVLFAGGVSVMTAITARNVIDDLAMCLGVGISGALLLMTQVFFSEEDGRAVKRTATAAAISITVGVGALSISIFLAAPLIIRLFGLDSQNAALAVTAIRYFAVSLILISLNEMLFDYLQAVKKYKWAHIFIVFQRLTILPVAYILIRFFGISGLFMSYILGEVIVTVGYVFVLLILNKKECTGMLNSLLCIPSRFSNSSNRALDIDIAHSDEVTSISEMIERFCLEHGIEKRRAMHASLCAEETAYNIIHHGFTKDNASHSCSIRIIISQNEVVLRFRDDCKFFNMKERFILMKDSEPSSNIGIKLVCNIAKEIQYSHVLNLNTLIITL